MTARLHEPNFTKRARDKLTFAAPLFIFAVTLLFLYVLRPIEMSDNSLGYLAQLQQASLSDPPFYPPHLLHMPLILLLHSLLSKISSSCDVACAGMAQSMIWAAIAIVSTYLIARVAFGTVVAAIAVAATVLVAHGFWVYATQIEVYVPSVGCMMAATALLFTSRTPELSAARVIAVSAFWALATMYHTANIFLFIPFCAFFFGTQGWRGWRQLATVSALAGSVVLATFVAAYVWNQPAGEGVGGFLPWVLEITDRPLTAWGSLSNWWRPSRLIGAAWSQIKALAVLPTYLTLDLRAPLDQLPLAMVGALIALVALTWNGIQVLMREQPVLIRVYFLLLFVINFLFFAWWEPSTHKFYIPSSIPLIMLTALATHDLYVRLQGGAACLLFGGAVTAVIAVIFILNLPSVLELRLSRGPFYTDAEILNKLAPEHCTIYSVGSNLSALEFYFGRHRGLFIVSVERDFYRLMVGDAPHLRTGFKGEECAFIPLGFLAKERYDQMIGKYLDTASWPQYVGYVLDAKDSVGGGITYNPFDLVSEGDSPPNLLIDRRRRVQAASIEEPVERIRVEIDYAFQKFERDYRSEDLGWLLLAVPARNVDFGLDRDLIFGYGWGGFARRPLDWADR